MTAAPTLPTSRLLEETQKRMNAARELAAGDLLKWEKVTAAIGEAAGHAHHEVELVAPVGVALDKSETASAVVTKLRGLGFLCDWQTRRPKPDAPSHQVLVVSW